MIGIAVSTVAIWLYLVLGNGGFWLARERDTRDVPPAPAPSVTSWPDVVAIVPARDEADVIARAIGSLADQDYPGDFRIVLVDDGSSDGTADIARDAGGDRLTIVRGTPLPVDWTGKLWAVSQGIAAAESPRYLWLTDADIAHAPDTLRSLVARADHHDLALVSLMAKLRCTHWAERALIPAFVYFFQMLYPFSRVNGRGPGAAAGGCMLVRREALALVGGIGAIRGALIDDCAFGALMKTQGPVWLGLTERSRSIRPYDGIRPIAEMISRSAYAQLDYSPLKLIGAVIGLALVYAAPPLLALFADGPARALGIAAWLLMTLSFLPMLRFYRRSPLWSPCLPLIAAFYTGCTLLSAWQHGRGRGGMWKGRAQAARQ
ncbi:glycosyltransferase [Sphingomonas sp. Leaf242]|uniref:glycosyltransferase n=1 Tax=Sphingomonas sp. Leaf242 TaxID=1736304 RepID=UPI000712BE2C|nr:glycosyltransferase [Sphingomonas sp. Leaf242]KQO09079.1 glycosyl transferase family 2 [Sphingomonas sp. Leaf242]